MDTAYLKQNLGSCLTQCLAEISEKRPRDPIEFMAQWLYKYKENELYINKVSLHVPCNESGTILVVLMMCKLVFFSPSKVNCYDTMYDIVQTL